MHGANSMRSTRRRQSPIAGEVIARIAALYRIEDAIRGRPPDERVAVRQRESRPKVEALKVYLETQLGRISGKSTLATAIRYALNHWDGLCVFLSDGRVEIDTNTIERLHRIVATGRRNALFAGSDAGARSWAIFTSLIQSARLNGLDPFAYLKDVLEQIVSGRVKNHELARLLPWNWKAERTGRTRPGCLIQPRLCPNRLAILARDDHPFKVVVR